jgi:peptide/nickel transport system permease protein
MATAEVTTAAGRQLRDVPAKPRTFWNMFWRALLLNRWAMASVVVLSLLALTTIAAPMVAPDDPERQQLRARLEPPSSAHLLGTDAFGRDNLSRIIYGARYSLTIGLISVSIAMSLGLIFGLTAGYAGGWVDMLIMRLTDVMLAFPGIMLAIIIMAMLGPSLQNAMIAVGLQATPRYIRVIRASTLSAKENLYVEAARSIGAQPWTVVGRHILPNIWAPVIVIATLGIATAILAGAGLSFLGLGAQPPTPEWGAMLSNGRDYLRQAWWVATFPGLAIVITVMAINLLGDGLRDALDPQLQRR